MRLPRKLFVSLVTVTFSATWLIPSLMQPSAASPQQSAPVPLRTMPPIAGGMMGMGSFMMGGAGAQMMPMNPLRSSIPILILRDDVRTELLISAQQREQIDKIETSSRQEMVGKMQSHIQELIGSARRKGAPISPGDSPSAFDSETPTQRKMRMEESQTQIKAMMTHILDDVDAKLEKILRPKQIARLHQLDLQYRGPLALLDPKVSDALSLNPEERQKIDELGAEYHAAQLKAISNAMRGLQRPAPPAPKNDAPTTPVDPAAPVNPPLPDAPTLRRPEIPLDSQTIQSKLADARIDTEKSRKALGKKALTLITPEHSKRWNQLIGRAFIFRLNQ